ncbi:MAG: glycosyltransferase [Bacteroidales bacterium]|nr:glycosyltransferase [Bacteroidales bacterium]
MKILQLIPSLHNGGAERFVCELSNELNKSFKVFCDIALMYGDESTSNNLKSSLDHVNCYNLYKKTGFSISYLFNIYKFIKHNKYDVVHAHLNCITYLILAAFLLPKVKFVATIHSDARFEASNRIVWFVRKLLFKSKRVVPITISEESNRSFVEYYNLQPQIIYNGLSPYAISGSKGAILRQSKEDLIFVHPASCQPVKNQKLLLSVFKKITQKYNNVYLYWFGSNGAYPDLFADLSVFFSDNIKYCGCVNNLRDYLYEADAMCLSSLVEGMPMVVIEAFSVGCVPLVTPAGGCINMIENNYNGFVANGFGEGDYFEMIERFISLSLEEKKKIRHNSLTSFQLYDVFECAKAYIEVYKS